MTGYVPWSRLAVVVVIWGASPASPEVPHPHRFPWGAWREHLEEAVEEGGHRRCRQACCFPLGGHQVSPGAARGPADERGLDDGAECASAAASRKAWINSERDSMTLQTNMLHKIKLKHLSINPTINPIPDWLWLAASHWQIRIIFTLLCTTADLMKPVRCSDGGRAGRAEPVTTGRNKSMNESDTNNTSI